MGSAIYNGKLINEEEAKVSVLDKGYYFDFAVYTSLKVIKRKPFFSKYHVERLFDSAKQLDLRHSMKVEDVLSWVDLLIEDNNIDNALLRIILIGDADKNENPKLFINKVTGLTFYPDKFYKRGVKVIAYNGERLLPKSKNKSLLLNFLAYREARDKGAVDSLLVDGDGFIREGTTSNFFVIKGNKIITPPRDKVLGGITKKIIFKVAKDEFEIVERDILLEDVMNGEYDEMFISSTSKNIMPINQIDDTVFESDFAKTKIVQKLFKEYYRRIGL